MNNVIEYLRWRGDILLKDHPLCEADYLVLAALAYMPFDGIVTESHTTSVDLGTAAAIVEKRLLSGEENKLLMYDESVEFIKVILTSPRFLKVRVCGYENIFSIENQEQFSAVTFLVPDGYSERYFPVISFRGTDATLVGWKEDFNMAYLFTVPAQLDAVKYIEKTANAFPDQPFSVCGHSKGGNLAVFGSAFCQREIQDRIFAVRNLDGPGFLEEVVEQEGFQRILGRVETVVPSSSIVGILLEHAEDFTVIKSYGSASFQHNPFMWEIYRDGYVVLESITAGSKYLDKTLGNWIDSMTPEQTREFVNGIYRVLTSAGVYDVRELFKGRNLLMLIRELRKLDSDSSKILVDALSSFKREAQKNLPMLFEKKK